jgi:membrane protein involved in colicin uptake
MTVSALDEDNNLVDNFDLNSDYEVCSQYVEGDKAKYEAAKVEVERQLAESNKAAKDAKKKAEKEAKAKAKAKKEAEEQAKKEAEEKAATEESA